MAWQKERAGKWLISLLALLVPGDLTAFIKCVSFYGERLAVMRLAKAKITQVVVDLGFVV